MAKLLLIRHGKIEGEETRYYGHIDIDLSQEGIKQAEILRDRLASENIDAIYSSDLRRALHTAEIIAVSHKLNVVPCCELREFDFGELNGMTFEEMKQRYPGTAKLLSGQDADMNAPSGESLRQMSTRIKRFVAQVQKQASECRLLIVAHGGSLKVLLCLLLGISLEHWWQFRLDLASLAVVETRSEEATLCRLNDTSHLTGVRR